MIRDLNSPLSIRSALNILTYAVGAIVFACIYEHVQILYSVAFAALFALSAWLDYGARYHVPRRLLVLVSMVVVAFSLYRLDLNELVTQMIEALLLLLAIKFLEEKKFRDYMQIYAIALFMLAGLGLLSLSIVFLVYFLVLIFILTVSIVLLTFHEQDPELTLSRGIVIKIISKSLLIPLIAIPLSVVMFIILPRSQYPLLDFLNRPDRAKTGFSDNVRLGSVSDIQEDNTIMLRVNMERVDEKDLYWRGITFDYFDGRMWRNLLLGRKSPGQAVSAGKSVRQTIYLEPYDHSYLFALDKPSYIAMRNVRMRGDLAFTAPKPIERRIRYEAVSTLSPTLREDEIERARYLQLPAGLSPGLTDLTRKITEGKTERERIEAIYRFLHDGSFSYSLKDLPLTDSPLEDFLLRNKYGNCEYFASAFAVMLRVVGIPARVVGGYKGGYFNDVGGYYLVPQKNAHLWTEVYTGDGFWVRMDPTPGALENYVSTEIGGTFFRLRMTLDSINYYWNALVINYNLEKQIMLLRGIRAGIKRPSFSFSVDKKRWMTIGLLVVALAAGAVIIRRAIVGRRRLEERVLRYFLKRMEEAGYKKKASQGLEEFLSAVEDGRVKRPAVEFVREYQELFYRDRPFTTGDARNLRKIARSVAGSGREKREP